MNKKWRVWLAINVVLVVAALGITHAAALTLATSSVIFPDVYLTGYDQTVLGVTTPWKVDASETIEGWNATISATNFENGFGGVIYISNLEFRLLNERITILSGNPVLPTSTQIEFVPLSETALKFISTESGNGVGVYELIPEFRLRIPAETYAGSYISRLTVTISVGP